MSKVLGEVMLGSREDESQLSKEGMLVSVVDLGVGSCHWPWSLCRAI